MLVIYDNNGTIVTADTKKENIVESLYSMEITIPAGKVLSKIDTSNVTHVPVFVDEPKTPTEMTIEQVKKTVPNLIRMDDIHNNKINALSNDVSGILQRLAQAELKIENLQK